ncbi:ABC transporter ATP-binding protein [Cryptosporangium aurantiacum]|uniref:Peptide/nickel transport system ATP-binding protein/oligopeptide transport system ATP-binding protein n=1 Tax=Cryptosporangium aurantiacum TaxID=134849 RepID=A0A1M7HAL9_9ACTN|nr:ATP-binding cassette domain-containing protein [Cryptosporangium aurantiacum]SHM25478.1 peptide/nickel transport system ATP-binding protein/oligopeptide transport system ATP-binding protein [Cryptosporangium aurantiacum]
MTPPVLAIENVTVQFRRGLGAAPVTALDDVTLSVDAGQTLGVVGESGSGKTTTGKVALGLRRPDSGVVRFNGRPLPRRARARAGRMQAVLQHPQESLDPRMRIGESIAEPLGVLEGGGLRRHRDRVDAMLRDVSLEPEMATRYPHELSGGQRQRVSIARALITHPDFVVFDEAVSALDVSVQARILDLIVRLQAEHGFAALFISHDLAAVRAVSARVAVMHDGVVVEMADTERFYSTPEHPYSRRLLEAL